MVALSEPNFSAYSAFGGNHGGNLTVVDMVKLMNVNFSATD